MDHITKRRRVPDYLYQHPETSAILTALEHAATQLEAAVADAIAQTNVATATWALPEWERSVGIQSVPGLGTETRRSAVMARMRGLGPTTPEQIRVTAAAFSNGEVAVVEQPAQHTVKVQFVGTVGIPKAIDQVIAAIADILPAHLLITYEYFYTAWDALTGKTWNELSAHTWDEVKELI